MEAVDQENQSLYPAKAEGPDLKKTVGENFQDAINALNLVYGKNQIKFAEEKNKITEHLKKIESEVEKKRFLQEITLVAKSLDGAIFRRNNITKRQEDLLNAAEKPGQVELKSFLNEMASKVGKNNNRWDSLAENYGPSDKLRDYQILNTDQVFYNGPYTGAGFHNYGLRLKRLKEQVYNEVTGSENYLQLLLNDGKVDETLRHLSPQGKLEELLRRGNRARYSKTEEAAKNVIEGVERFLVTPLQSLSNWAGKGLWSKSDPNKNTNYQDLLKKRAKLMQEVAMMNPNSSRRQKLLEKFSAILAQAQNGDYPSMNAALENMVQQEIAEEVKERETKLSSINEEVNAANKASFETAKDQTKEKDEMWKFRAMQAFLIITPFAGISVLGPVIGVFGNIFNGGVASGVVGVMHSFGPLSDVVEAMHLDDAVRWLLNDLPILKDLIGVVDGIFTSSIAQNVFGGVLAPVLSGPLASIALAGVVSVFRGGTEADYFEKYKKAFKGHDEKLQAAMEKLFAAAGDLKNLDSTKMQAFYKKVVDVQLKSAQEFSCKTKMVEFAAKNYQENSTFFTEILGEDFSKKLQQEKIINEEGALDEKLLMSSLIAGKAGSIKDVADDFFNKVALFSAAEKKNSQQDFAKKINEFKTLKADSGVSAIIQEEQQHYQDDFIYNLSRCYHNVENAVNEKHPTFNRHQKAEEMMKKITEKEINWLQRNAENSQDLAKHLTPSGVVQRANSVSLQQQQQRHA